VAGSGTLTRLLGTLELIDRRLEPRDRRRQRQTVDRDGLPVR
jgi:hypothetical protein